ncbi:MAG: hypothetical protein IKJ60_08205 [Ruminococcus sp.]|nr:hypothetical protein [Ruminococcus sp.]
MSRYEDIINLPHHQSDKRPHMSNYERAAQFSPFAALTGFDDEINEAARLTDCRPQLTEDQLNSLDEAIQRISDLDKPLIAVTFFVPDVNKSGGSYRVYTGTLRFLDLGEGKLKFTDDTAIPLDDVVDVRVIDDTTFPL